MRLVLIGAPASGKGTQGDLISKKYGIPTISVGHMLREVAQENSKWSKTVYEYISQGKLVPVDITIGLIKNRIAQADCKNGFILDGFPRDMDQAKSLKEIDKVVFLSINKENMIARILQRGRLDDNMNALENRIREYNERTLPVIELYRKQGKLITIDANGTVEEVFERIIKGLK